MSILVEWRPVVGWEGYYEVSDRGQVRSLERTVTYRDGRVRLYPSTVLRVGHHGIGHEHVVLYRSATDKASRQVHRLVLEAFVGPCPDDGMECLHADGDPANNHVTNLRWGTRSENNLDKVRHGHDHNAVKTHCPQGHPYSDENTYVYPTGNRRCRVCKREAQRRYDEKRRGAA